MTKIKCEFCGVKTKITKGVKYCPKCGYDLIQKKRNLADISIVLDRSGSMSDIKQATIDSFNRFLSEQKEVPAPATMSLYQFDDVYEVIYENIDIKEAMPLNSETYQPRASTALLDAVGRTISNRWSYISKLDVKNKPDKVIVVIITDGYENASVEYNRKQIFEMVKKYREEYNWQFVFLGANIDAFAESGSLGISPASTYYFLGTDVGISTAFSGTSYSMCSFRTSDENDFTLQNSPYRDTSDYINMNPNWQSSYDKKQTKNKYKKHVRI